MRLFNALKTYSVNTFHHFEVDPNKNVMKQILKLKTSSSTIMFIIFSDVLMVQQSSISPQVKRNLIVSNKLVYI